MGCARGGPAPSCGRVPERRGALRAGPGGSAGLLRREPGRAAAGRGLPEPRGSPPAAGEGCPDPAPGGVRLCPVSRAGNRGELSGSSCFLAVREVGVGMGFLNIVIKSGNYRDWYRSVNEAAFRACGRSDHLAAIPRLAGGSSSSRPCPALLCLAARCGRATGNATAAGYAAAPRPAGRLLGSSLLGLRARGCVASCRAACDRKAALLLGSPHGSRRYLTAAPSSGPPGLALSRFRRAPHACPPGVSTGSGAAADAYGVLPTLAVLWALLRGDSNMLSFARCSRKQLYTRAENVTSIYYVVSPFARLSIIWHLGLGS